MQCFISKWQLERNWDSPKWPPVFSNCLVCFDFVVTFRLAKSLNSNLMNQTILATTKIQIDSCKTWLNYKGRKKSSFIFIMAHTCHFISAEVTSRQKSIRRVLSSRGDGGILDRKEGRMANLIVETLIGHLASSLIAFSLCPAPHQHLTGSKRKWPARGEIEAAIKRSFPRRHPVRFLSDSRKELGMRESLRNYSLVSIQVFAI